MLEDLNLTHVLFLDIETVPQYPDFNQLPESTQRLWAKKAKTLYKDEDNSPSEIYSRAGIYAEFGKIICISAGVIFEENKERKLRLKSFFSDDERKLLTDFSDMVEKFSSDKKVNLCAHNGKEFDFPYIARRILINRLKLPKILQVAGKKPWDVPFLDTMELWRFGDYKNYTSLELLTHIFDIETPKQDIDGSMVNQVYWQNKELDRIVEYCQRDVVAIAQLMLRYKGDKLIDEKNIEIA